MSGDGPQLCANAYCREPLSGEEIEHPCRCGIPTPLGQDVEICRVAICDECAAGLASIPPEVYGTTEPGKPYNGCYDAFACSEHFNEAWV